MSAELLTVVVDRVPPTRLPDGWAFSCSTRLAELVEDVDGAPLAVTESPGTPHGESLVIADRETAERLADALGVTLP